MNIFETIMLICFGASWPLSIIKSYRSRSAKGKSVLFLCFLELGYIMGMIFNYTEGMDIGFFLYMLNFSMIGVDLGLTLRNRRLDAQAAA